MPGTSASTAFPPPPPIDNQWKQVEGFPEDNGDEWEEEVEYLTLDLGPSHDHKNLPPDANFQLLGLNSPTPFLKIAGQCFMGTHERLIGTELIMQEGHKTGSKPCYDPLVSLTARVRFRPVTLEPLAPPGESANSTDTTIHMRHWASRHITNQKVSRAKRPKAAKRTQDERNGVLVVAAKVDEGAETADPSLIDLTSDTERETLLSAKHNSIATQSDPIPSTNAEEQSIDFSPELSQCIPVLGTPGLGQQQEICSPEHTTGHFSIS